MLEAQRLEIGDRLPSLELPVVPGGRLRSLVTHSRDATVLVTVPRDGERWNGYLEELARAGERIEKWDARIFLAVAGDAGHAAGMQARAGEKLTVLADEEAAACRHIDFSADRMGLVIADRFGQIYEIMEPERPGDLPPPAEIEEWAKFLATQCPECGVIDDPAHGEWRGPIL